MVVWQLQDSGFSVILPPGLNSDSKDRLGVKIKAKVARKKGDRLGLKSLLNYKLELAIGDKSLSKEDFERLLDQKINAEFALYEGYALMEIAQNIAFRNLTNLTGETFDTILGPVTFGADGRAQWAPFVVSVWNGQSFTRESVGQ